MRAASFTATVALLYLAASVSAADLRVTCEPGQRVIVNGEPAGVCTAEDRGLVIAGLEPGPHALRLEDAGGAAAEVTVDIGQTSRQIAFADAASVGGDGVGSGSIEFATDAPRCWVEVGGQRIEKLEPELTVHGLPAGRRTVWLQELGTLLEARVEVVAGTTVRLEASFADRTTVVETPEPAAAAAGAETEECFHYWIEVLQTSSVENVGKVSEVLDEEGYPIHHQDVVTVHTGEMPLYRLRVGPFANRFSADRTLFKIGSRDLPGARVVKEPCR